MARLSDTKPVARIMVNVQGAIEVRKCGRHFIIGFSNPIVAFSKAEALREVRRYFRRTMHEDCLNVGRIEWTEAAP